MSSSISGFVHRNKQAVIATAVVVSVGAAAGVYYAYKSAPEPVTDEKTEASDKAASSSSSGAATGGAASSNASKNKKKKKKNTGNNNNKQEDKTKTLHGIPLGEDDHGNTFPKVDKNTELRGLTVDELKEVAAALKVAGNAAFNNKEHKRAIELYTGAIRCNDKDPVYYSNRAACYNSLQEYQKVIEDTTTALALKPDYLKCVSRRAIAYEKLGKYPEAIFDFTATCILGDFKDNSLNAAVDRVLKLQAEKISAEKFGDMKHQMPSPQFVKAYLGSFRKRDLPESVVNAKQDSGDYKMKLAFDCLEQETAESYEQAKTYFEQAVDEKAQNMALALEFRGTFKFLLGDAEGALSDINKSLKLAPSVQAYVKRSSIHMEESKVMESFEDFNKALQLDPNSSDVYYHRGQVAFLTGEFEKAIEDYEKSASLDKEFKYSQIQLAVTQYRSGQVDTAISAFKDLLKKFPQSSDIHNYYGEILLDQQKFDQSVKEFDTAIELETTKTVGAINVLCLVNKAMAVFQMTQSITEAEALCKKAATLDPSSDVAIGALAQFCLQQGKTAEALELFEKNAQLARSEQERVQALQYAEAAKTQLKITKERPDLRSKLERLTASG